MSIPRGAPTPAISTLMTSMVFTKGHFGRTLVKNVYSFRIRPDSREIVGGSGKSIDRVAQSASDEGDGCLNEIVICCFRSEHT